MGRGINSRNRVWNWVAKQQLAGQYGNPMPTWFLAPIAGLKLTTLYDNPIPTRFLDPIDCSKIPALFTPPVDWSGQCGGWAWPGTGLPRSRTPAWPSYTSLTTWIYQVYKKKKYNIIFPFSPYITFVGDSLASAFAFFIENQRKVRT